MATYQGCVPGTLVVCPSLYSEGGLPVWPDVVPCIFAVDVLDDGFLVHSEEAEVQAEACARMATIFCLQLRPR